MYLGLYALGTAIRAVVVSRHITTLVPTDSNPALAYRVYGPTGIMDNGTGSLSARDSGTITAAANAAPIVITSASHKLTNAARVTVAGVGGNTGANGDWDIVVVDANTFQLTGSTGNGTYTSGGTWHAAGVYDFNYTPTALNGFVAGTNYSVYINTTDANIKPTEPVLSFTVV